MATSSTHAFPCTPGIKPARVIVISSFCSCDAGLTHDLAPAADLRCDEAIELRRRAFADRDELQIGELLGDLRLGDGRIHGSVELRHHILRRSARNRDRLPGGPVEARQTDLGEWRNL